LEVSPNDVSSHMTLWWYDDLFVNCNWV